MHTQKEALAILGCSKQTLSNYVKDGKLTRHKEGRRTYYDEREVARLLPEIEAKREKYRPDLPPPDPAPPPPPKEPPRFEINTDLDLLDEHGLEVLAQTTKQIEELGIFDEIDRYALEQYAFHVQEARRYALLAKQEDSITFGAMGGYVVHPHHRVMKDHQKQAQFYMDRLGLTPASRKSIGVEKKKKPSSIMDVINASKQRD